MSLLALVLIGAALVYASVSCIAQWRSSASQRGDNWRIREDDVWPIVGFSEVRRG